MWVSSRVRVSRSIRRLCGRVDTTAHSLFVGGSTKKEQEAVCLCVVSCTISIEKTPKKAPKEKAKRPELIELPLIAAGIRCTRARAKICVPTHPRTEPMLCV
jgi:hypothetical protein